MDLFRLTFRKLKKNKAATALGIAGLIVGLVSVMYIFFWVSDEAGYDRFHKNIDRIFVVHAYLEGGTKKVDFQGCPPAVAPALKEEYPEVENSCRYIPPYIESLLSANGKKNMIKVACSDFSLFDIFTLPFINGNKGELNDPKKIVLTETAAARIFGDTDPVGKIVRFQNSLDLTVSGVIKDIPDNSTIQFGAVIPLESIQSFSSRNDYLSTWYNNAFATYGLLTSPAGFDKVSSTITRRIQKEMPESTNYLRAYMFKNGYLYEQKHIRNVKIFCLIGFMVLIAAILNFINLITARSTKQAKETGLRKSIGATRGNIIKLIYSDVAFLCLLAFVSSLLIAICGLPLFSHLIGKHILLSSLFSPVPIGILLLVYAVTVFLAGSYPAFFLSSFSVSETLKSNFHTVKNRGIFRNSLMISIFIVSIILLTSTLIISKQTLFLQKMDIGYNKEQLLYIGLDGKLKEKAKTLKDEILRSPGVSSATVTSFLPVMIGNNGEGWNWEGKDENFKPLVTDWETDEDMVETLGAKLIEGDYFSLDRQGIVINKAFADVIGWDSFAGKTLNSYGTDHPIVGVISNIQYNSLSETCRPMAISQISDWSTRYMLVKVTTDQLNKTISTIGRACEKIEPDFPFNYGFIDDAFAQLLTGETGLKKLVGIFSVFAMIVLCLGLLGVVMFIAEQRTKEIGVRKCMGESVSSIILEFVKPFVFSGLAASLIAIPATWFIMSRWLQNYTYRIELHIWIFFLVVLISIAIAVATVGWQSWRAATRNPVEALRYE